VYTEIEDFIPGLAILYHVKIGRKGEKREKKGGGGTYSLPEKVDHFLITGRERDKKDDNFIVDQAMMSKIGENAREIDIRFLYDDIALNFPHRLGCYVTTTDLKRHFKIESRTKRCYCTGNGREATRLTAKGKDVIECAPLTCNIYNEAFENVRCKPLARLIFTLPQMGMLCAAADFVTTSTETIRNIKGSLTMIQQMTQGIIAGIPLKLKMYSTTDETGTGEVRNWKVMVAFPGTEEDLFAITKQIAMTRSASAVDIRRIQHMAQKTIEHMVTEVETAEEEDLKDEFWPDKITAEPPTFGLSDEILTELNTLYDALGINQAGRYMEIAQCKSDEDAEKLKKELTAKVAQKKPETTETKEMKPETKTANVETKASTVSTNGPEISEATIESDPEASATETGATQVDMLEEELKENVRQIFEILKASLLDKPGCVAYIQRVTKSEIQSLEQLNLDQAVMILERMRKRTPKCLRCPKDEGCMMTQGQSVMCKEVETKKT